MLYTLQKHAPQVSYVAYDKNQGCGGTWYENRYPGCASDDPSHHYQYDHTPNPEWSSVFAPAPEIKEYLNTFIDKNNLRDSIKCGYSVSSAQWKEETGEWTITVKDERTGSILEDHAQVIIDATGIFKFVPATFSYRTKAKFVIASGSGHVHKGCILLKAP